MLDCRLKPVSTRLVRQHWLRHRRLEGITTKIPSVHASAASLSTPSRSSSGAMSRSSPWVDRKKRAAESAHASERAGDAPDSDFIPLTIVVHEATVAACPELKTLLAEAIALANVDKDQYQDPNDQYGRWCRGDAAVVCGGHFAAVQCGRTGQHHAARLFVDDSLFTEPPNATSNEKDRKSSLCPLHCTEADALRFGLSFEHGVRLAVVDATTGPPRHPSFYHWSRVSLQVLDAALGFSHSPDKSINNLPSKNSNSNSSSSNNVAYEDAQPHHMGGSKGDRFDDVEGDALVDALRHGFADIGGHRGAWNILPPAVWIVKQYLDAGVLRHGEKRRLWGKHGRWVTVLATCYADRDPTQASSSVGLVTSHTLFEFVESEAASMPHSRITAHHAVAENGSGTNKSHKDNTFSAGGSDAASTVVWTTACRRLMSMVELTRGGCNQLFDSVGVVSPFPVLLVTGSSGVGKTTAVDAVADRLNATTIRVHASDLYTQCSGDPAVALRQQLRRVHDAATMHACPVVVIIDDAEALFPALQIRATTNNKDSSADRHGPADDGDGDGDDDGWYGSATEQQAVEGLIGEFVQHMHQHAMTHAEEDVIVLLVTVKPHWLDARVRQLVSDVVKIENPSKRALFEIARAQLEHHETRAKVPLSDKSISWLRDAIDHKLHGAMPADIVALCRHLPVCDEGTTAQTTAAGREKVWLEVLRRRVQQFVPTALHGAGGDGLIVIRPTSDNKMQAVDPFDSVGGLDDVKEALRRSVVGYFRNPACYRALSIDPPAAVLLYGVAGTGKTHLARAIANAAGSNFIALDLSQCVRAELGESEKQLKRAFTRARQAAPAILFVDEIQSVFGGRQRRTPVFHEDGSKTDETKSRDDEDTSSGSDDETTDYDDGQNAGSGSSSLRLVSQLLIELDHVREHNRRMSERRPGNDAHDGGIVVVVAATNAPFAIDAGFLSPNRFGLTLRVPPPTSDAVGHILRIRLRDMLVDEHVFEQLVCQPVCDWPQSIRVLLRRCVRWCGADVVQWCNLAGLTCVRRHAGQVASIVASITSTAGVASRGVSLDDLTFAHAQVRPSVSAAALARITQWEKDISSMV